MLIYSPDSTGLKFVDIPCPCTALFKIPHFSATLSHKRHRDNFRNVKLLAQIISGFVPKACTIHVIVCQRVSTVKKDGAV